MRPQFPQALLKGRRLPRRWLPSSRGRGGVRSSPAGRGAPGAAAAIWGGQGTWSVSMGGVGVRGGCAQLPPSSGTRWQVATATLANLRRVLPCNCFNSLMGNNKTVIK